MVRIFIGITHRPWFTFLAAQAPDEVNFWQPSGSGEFKALRPGDLFLFKLKGRDGMIAGGGVFNRASLAPLSLAWEAFGEKNGNASLVGTADAYEFTAWLGRIAPVPRAAVRLYRLDYPTPRNGSFHTTSLTDANRLISDGFTLKSDSLEEHVLPMVNRACPLGSRQVYRLFNPRAVAHRFVSSLDTYNALLPRRDELAATLFLEITGSDTIADDLLRFRGLENNCLFLDIGDAVCIPATFALDGLTHPGKLAAVHDVRFPLGPEGAALVSGGCSPLTLRIDHPQYAATTTLPAATHDALREDLC